MKYDEEALCQYVDPNLMDFTLEPAGRTLYSAEVEDKLKFMAWVFLNEDHLKYVLPNQTELNKLARKLKGAFDVPGVKLVAKKGGARSE